MAAERVSGAKAIAGGLDVIPSGVQQRGDTEIAQAAERTVRPLKGVVSVTDNNQLKALPIELNLSERIQDALIRQAIREARRIDVLAEGSEVSLRGRVRSWA